MAKTKKVANTKCPFQANNKLFEPEYLAVSLGVSNLEKTGAISKLYIDYIVAKHVLERHIYSIHPIDVDKPCGPHGANTIAVLSVPSQGAIIIELPEEVELNVKGQYHE